MTILCPLLLVVWLWSCFYILLVEEDAVFVVWIFRSLVSLTSRSFCKYIILHHIILPVDEADDASKRRSGTRSPRRLRGATRSSLAT